MNMSLYLSMCILQLDLLIHVIYEKDILNYRANENNWVFGDKCTTEENVQCKRNIFEDPSTAE